MTGGDMTGGDMTSGDARDVGGWATKEAIR